MSPWVKKVFTQIMPRVLLMKRPIYFCQGSCGEDRKKKNFYNGIDYGLVMLWTKQHSIVYHKLMILYLYDVVNNRLAEAAGTIQLHGSTHTPTAGIRLRKSTVNRQGRVTSWLPLNYAPPPTAATHPINPDTSITVWHSHVFDFVRLIHPRCFCHRLRTANVWRRWSSSSGRDVRLEKCSVHSQTH